MLIWIIVLIYLFVGCIRTAFNLAINCLDIDEDEVSVSAAEIVSSSIGWGVVVVVLPLTQFIVSFIKGDD